MRVALLTAVLVMSTQALFAEREALIEYNDQWNLFSKFEVTASEIDQDTGVLGGVSVGGLLNDQVGIGIAGNILIDSVVLESTRGQSIDKNDFWYAGGYLEYVFSPESLVYFSLDALIGGGEMELTPSFSDDDSATVFVFEPGLNLMINITETFNFGIGLGYRMVENADFRDLESGDVSGMTGSVFLRFTEF